MQIDPILAHIIERGFCGASELSLLCAFAECCNEHGLPLSLALAVVDSPDPVFEGRVFRWRDDEREGYEKAYGSTDEGEAAESWQRTPFYELAESGRTEMRICLHKGERTQSLMVAEIADRGATDYVAFVHYIPKDAAIGELDCVYSHFATREAGGFTDEQLDRLRCLVGGFALAIKAATLARLTRTLAYVYLGHGAAETVLRGRLLRGMADRIDAVLWWSDLRSFTTISERLDAAEVIPFLNDYADAAISAIHDAGGETLKLIGDGVLAVFRDGSQHECGVRALKAEAAFRRAAAEVTARRTHEGRATTSAYVALHLGAVFYGNIGSATRLDFTVVGPAVNEVSRIGAMCRSVDRDFLVSEGFRDALDPELQSRFVSTGRFALRGVERSQDLFTLDPVWRHTVDIVPAACATPAVPATPDAPAACVADELVEVRSRAAR